MRVCRLPAIDWFLLKVATTLTPVKSHTLGPSLGSTRRGLARKPDLAWRLPAPPLGRNVDHVTRHLRLELPTLLDCMGG